jgi:hypothetical protein
LQNFLDHPIIIKQSSNQHELNMQTIDQPQYVGIYDEPISGDYFYIYKENAPDDCYRLFAASPTYRLFAASPTNSTLLEYVDHNGDKLETFYTDDWEEHEALEELTYRINDFCVADEN